ncbi:MAG: cytochrome c [Nitrospirota bacterium]|nr:cytochrome c [Nitrospirota bacterium]
MPLAAFFNRPFIYFTSTMPNVGADFRIIQELIMMNPCSYRIGILFFLLFSTSPFLVFSQGPLGNPKEGKILYEKHCALCHGTNGNGDGPDTQYLKVSPANFHSLESRSKTDWDLMTIITFGAAFSPMHGWADRLTEEERWDVLRYIRILAPFNPMAVYPPSING